MHTWAYGLSDEGVWVHLYGGSRLDLPLDSGSRLCLVQETAYPWEGVVRITVEAAPARSYGIMLRIPSWARKARVKVNGQVPDVDIQPGTYAALRRRWSVGDVIELDLPMSPRLVQAHPKVEEAFNQIAVMRGPLVYCLESVDLPDRTSIDNVFISRGAQWTAKFNPDLLGGLVVLEGVGYRAYSTDWTGQLYRDLAQTEFTDVPIRLIPYYAWNNRGATKMTVWLPLLQ